MNSINIGIWVLTGVPFESESVLFVTDLHRFIVVAILVIIDIAIFASFEKLMKEDWVLKTSFEKSFRQMITIIDTSPNKIVICDVKGEILFANSAFITSSDDAPEKINQQKLGSFIASKFKDSLYKSLLNS